MDRGVQVPLADSQRNLLHDRAPRAWRVARDVGAPSGPGF